MKPIVLGKNASNKPISLTPALRQRTHMHVIGGSGSGKSKFLEWLIRQDIREGHGFCVIDWHGTLYQDVLNYCAQLDVGLDHDFRSLLLLNPSKPDFITGYNPFMNQGEDISVQVQKRIDATIRPWGITDTNQMPTFERVCRVIYTFAAEQREPLHNVQQLLRFNNADLREYALTVLRDARARGVLEDLQMSKTPRDWREFVLSTENRLGRFLASTAIRRFMGLAEGNLDLLDVMDNQKILLVNLGASGYLDREAARVFASLFLYEFFETAMRRAQLARQRGEAKPQTFTLYLDEFQEYITDDIADMLDQVRKGGLYMALAHQHLGHVADNPRLRKSIFTNARIRAVFGGLDYEDASLLANEMFLPDLNTRQIKKAYYHTIHLYREERRASYSHAVSRGTSTSASWGSGGSNGAGFSTTTGTGRGRGTSITVPGTAAGVLGSVPEVEGWFTESESESTFSAGGSSEFSAESWSEGGSTTESYAETEGETSVPVWVPIPMQELGSEAEWSREEKVSKVAELLKTQQQQHCFIKLDTEQTQPLKVPFVRDYSHSPEYLLEYEQAVYQHQGALPAATVDQLITENETKFLTQAREVIAADQPPEQRAPEAAPAGPAPPRIPNTRAKKPKPST